MFQRRQSRYVHGSANAGARLVRSSSLRAVRSLRLPCCRYWLRPRIQQPHWIDLPASLADRRRSCHQFRVRCHRSHRCRQRVHQRGASIRTRRPSFARPGSREAFAISGTSRCSALSPAARAWKLCPGDRRRSVHRNTRHRIRLDVRRPCGRRPRLRCNRPRRCRRLPPRPSSRPCAPGLAGCKRSQDTVTRAANARRAAPYASARTCGSSPPPNRVSPPTTSCRASTTKSTASAMVASRLRSAQGWPHRQPHALLPCRRRSRLRPR